ncbi:MAG: M28 family peptidase [Planctomycetes bacterium]|nr:M28 family peptidase [Planctomycetota bacterium]
MTRTAFLHGLSFFALLAAASSGPGCGRPEAAPGPALDAANAWKHLEALVALGPRPPKSPALEATRAYLEAELARAGLTPVREAFEASTPVGTIALANVYADLAATNPAAERVYLATHFDTKLGIDGFVGANDGGSGTALLLELARAMKAAGPRELAYRFLFLDGEEATRAQWQGEDNCYGSRHHARALVKSGEAARVRAFVLLDMVGDRELGLLRETWSDRRLNDLFRAAAARIGDAALFTNEAQPIEDDHGPFLDAGIPSIDLIDFEYGPANAYWHTRDDSLAHCSQESLRRVGALVLAALPTLEREFRRGR